MSNKTKQRKRTIEISGVVFFLDKHGTPKGAGLLTVEEIHELLMALHKEEQINSNQDSQKRTIKLNGEVLFVDKKNSPKGAGLLTTHEAYELIVLFNKKEK